MEKFEKLDNDQKELVKYWIDRFYKECSPLSRHEWIEKHLTPVFNPKVGTWYFTIDDESNEYLFNHQENGKSYGFFKGKWSDTTYWDTFSNWTHQPREATPEKVKQRLIKEANRRGFVEGAKFKNKNGMNQTCIGKFQYYSNKNNLHCTAHEREWNIHGCHSNPIILNNGKWAEIIDEKAEIRESVARLEAEYRN